MPGNLPTRRAFLRLAALAPSLLAAAAAPRRSPKNVIVIGAGLAGLCCAYELSNLGHAVSVLEARRRPGGRVRTVRDFVDGLHAEAGAARIPPNHELTLGYAHKFSLTTTPFYPDELDTENLMRGKLFRVPAGGSASLRQYPVELTDDEVEMGFGGLAERAFTQPLADLGNPRDPDWPLGPARKYDAMTYHEHIEACGLSPDVAELFMLGFQDPGGLGWSAAWVLREVALAPIGGTMVKIVGGNDLLPRAFAARLKGQILYGAAVNRIDQTGERVQVMYTQGGKQHALSADRIVCTVPFPVMHRIEITPELPAPKRRAINEMSYASLSRVSIQMRRRFWREGGLNGFALTDQPSEIWDATFEHDTDRSLMHIYMKGSLSEELTSQSGPQRIQTALDKIAEVFPGAHEFAEGGIATCWDEDPWAGGAAAALTKGQMTELLPHAGTPEGRIHFGGEHTSAWHGWMQGALASGRRTAREVEEA